MLSQKFQIFVPEGLVEGLHHMISNHLRRSKQLEKLCACDLLCCHWVCGIWCHDIKRKKRKKKEIALVLLSIFFSYVEYKQNCRGNVTFWQLFLCGKKVMTHPYMQSPGPTKIISVCHCPGFSELAVTKVGINQVESRSNHLRWQEVSKNLKMIIYKETAEIRNALLRTTSCFVFFCFFFCLWTRSKTI